MKLEHVHRLQTGFPDLIVFLPFVAALALYACGEIVSSQRYGPWPKIRSICWLAGVLSAAAAVAGPIAVQARTDFAAHMIGHVLLGMLAPLLLALAAPVTLLLRTLSVRQARRLSRWLADWPLPRLLTDPAVASLLNVGGLWILYTTGLYGRMHHFPLLHFLVHVHIFLAGYWFTAAFLYIDPVPHRRSFVYRAAVLTLAWAAHDILAKFIYAHPPAGVPAEQAEAAGMIMYYGGDAVDLALIVLFCFQWYKARRVRGDLLFGGKPSPGLFGGRPSPKLSGSVTRGQDRHPKR